MLIGLIVYLFILSVVWAVLEIQIEGKNGWASALPTWRKKEGWIVKLLGGRPLTGYHICMITFLALVYHFPFFFTPWNLGKELFTIGFFFGFLLIEDFLWFVLNPAFRLKRFNRKNPDLWWHKSWWGPVPDFYWWYTVAAVVLMYFGYKIW